MKKLSLFVLFSCVLCSNLFGQFKKGDVELSLSASFASFSESVESRNFNFDSESQQLFILTARPGFFIIDYFEIEPEISWTTIKDMEPSYNLAINPSYNFQMKDSKIFPFVTAGIGIGNSIQIFGVSQRTSDKFDVFNINAGAGLKIMLNDNAALRIEYRFQRYSFSHGDSPYETDYTFYLHKLMFGFSILL